MHPSQGSPGTRGVRTQMAAGTERGTQGPEAERRPRPRREGETGTEREGETETEREGETGTEREGGGQT